MSAAFKPKLFISSTCPYCMKVQRFLAQANLLDKLEIVACDAGGENELNRYRTFLTKKLGQQASFPAAEIAPDQFMKESNDLIDYFAGFFGVTRG